MTLPDKDTLLQTYGGALNDYGTPVIDPTTDRPAAGANQQYASTAMMTRTAFRCFATITWVLPATGNGLWIVSRHDAVWEGANAAGLALNAVPTVTHVSPGVFSVTWPATVVDELGVSHTLSLRAAFSNYETVIGPARNSRTVVTAPNAVQVTVFDGGGSPIDPTQTSTPGAASDGVVVIAI